MEADYPTYGGWQSIHCPFHLDHTKSARINPELDAFKCHGCEVQGDSWKLLMEQEGINFIQAKRLAETELGHASENVQRTVDKRRKQYRPSWT